MTSMLWLTRRCAPQRVHHLGFANSAQAYKALGYSLYPGMVKVLLSCLHATNAISTLTYFVGKKRVGVRVVVWNGGKRYIYIYVYIYRYLYIFNNYMEKAEWLRKKSWCWSFSPVSRSRSTLTICLKVAKGPGWSRVVWPTSLSDYPFHFWPLVKELHGNWSNILNNQGHLTIHLSWTTNSVGL